MRISRSLILGGTLGAVALGAACSDERSITTKPEGELGFGAALQKVAALNLPRGFVRFPTAPIASATPATDSIIVTLRGLDSLSTARYVVWVGNDSATKFAQLTGNLRVVRVDTVLNAAGDPVIRRDTTNRTGINAFAIGGSGTELRFASSRAAASALAGTDSAGVFLVSIETGTPGAAPGAVRPIWARRSERAGTSDSAAVRFGNFAPRTADQFVFAQTTGLSATGANTNMLITPRGRAEFRMGTLVVIDSNYYRPPIGYFYAGYALRLDTISNRINDTIYLGPRSGPAPERVSLRNADVDATLSPVINTTQRTILAFNDRVRGDTIPRAKVYADGSIWREFGFLRVNLESKYKADARMGPATIMQATIPPSVRGR